MSTPLIGYNRLALALIDTRRGNYWPKRTAMPRSTEHNFRPLLAIRSPTTKHLLLKELVISAEQLRSV